MREVTDRVTGVGHDGVGVGMTASGMTASGMTASGDGVGVGHDGIVGRAVRTGSTGGDREPGDFGGIATHPAWIRVAPGV